MRWLDKHGVMLKGQLDWGSGRGFDANHYGMDQYDPHWHPKRPRKGKTYLNITCIYVFNVIPREDTIPMLLDMAQYLEEDGCIYAATRKDLKSEKRTGRGCIQKRNTLEHALPESAVMYTCSAFRIFQITHEEIDKLREED
jgi:hypothetical protein